jgi:hypothetical protein
MSRRLSLAFLSVAFAYGLSVAFAPPALAHCDVNLCISNCQKRGPQFATGNACTSYCLQTIDALKKGGKCNK